MSAVPSSHPAAVLRPMTHDVLDEVMRLELAVYPFPWSRGNFVDSLVAGHLAWTLHGDAAALVAYCVAMPGVGELHLLNITVAPQERRRGHGARLLGELVAQGRREGHERLWLEVRESNHEARATYARLGFATAGLRRGYYPAAGGRREDAVLMELPIRPDDGQRILHAVD